MTNDPKPVEPPGGGRQDHDTMHAAALKPIAGPASTDTLAAGGGLEIPGREAHPVEGPVGPAKAEPIPGERDPANLTHREPGAVGGQFAGEDIHTTDAHVWLDDATAREHEKEGGGEAARRSKGKGQR